MLLAFCSVYTIACVCSYHCLCSVHTIACVVFIPLLVYVHTIACVVFISLLSCVIHFLCVEGLWKCQIQWIVRKKVDFSYSIAKEGTSC